MESLILWGLVLLITGIAGTYAMHGVWRAWGAWRIRQAGPRPLAAVRHVLWRDPGNISRLNLVHGPGGADGPPLPPFRFLEEHFGGSQPCVSVVDAHGRRWRAKWGSEVCAETFAVRLTWACGYFSETTYYLPEGTIQGARELQRAASCIDEQCRFTAARFELDDPAVKKLFEEHSWAWNDNPFVGSHQLHGLKILTMLLSNWDTKDRRDVARGSNTAIFEHLAGGIREARYLITDWGGSMGSWGASIITRGRWDAVAYEAQTPSFVAGVQDGFVQFGYAGQRTEDVAVGITTMDVRWLLKSLARITDAQIAAALEASGATADERVQFVRAIRDRISQLERVANQ